MNVRRTFAVALMCLCMAVALPAGPARSQIVETADSTFTVELPSPVINLNNLNFGDRYVAINHTVSSASATLVPAVPTAGLTHVSGSPGGARLLPVDTTARNTLLVDITGGIAGAAIALTISDDNTGNPYLTLVGETTPADAVFRVDTWTFIILPGGGSLAWNGTTGTGTATLSPTGTIGLRFGATLRTVPSALTYSAQDYTGTLRITANY